MLILRESSGVELETLQWVRFRSFGFRFEAAMGKIVSVRRIYSMSETQK